MNRWAMDRTVTSRLMLVASRPEGDPILDYTYELPPGSRALTATLTGSRDIHIWFEEPEVANDEVLTSRRFAVIEEDEVIPPGYEYVATVVDRLRHTAHAFHVYEAPR